MPTIRAGDVRLPELHLPEITREDVARSLSEIRLPEAVSRIDVGKAIGDAVAATPMGRRTRRRRWPVALGAVVLTGVAGWIILSNESLRARLTSAARGMREQLATFRGSAQGIDAVQPIAFPAAETRPIETHGFAEPSTSDSTDYPDGLGSNDSDTTPAFEESGRPV